MEMNGDPEERGRRAYERVIAKIEPSLKGDPSRAPLYLELFKREFVEDTRTFAFDVSGAAGSGGRIVLSGHVEFPEHRQALATFFERLGLAIDDQTELLPSAKLGEKRFGVVTAPRTFVRDRPTGERRETLTECVKDDVVFLLKDAEGGQLLCHAPDGYVGYVAAADVRRIDGSEFDAIESAKPSTRKAEIDAVLAKARSMLGVKYVWGGGTPEGVDCSGLVRCAYRAANVSLPRDADQQSLVGRLVGTRWHRGALRPGDTLYFLGRRGTIHHTAVYIGDDKYIEATSPVAKITSFNPKHPEYEPRRAQGFCFAKRVIE
jgi:cell wall-associated NlpC family hydrolase